MKLNIRISVSLFIYLYINAIFSLNTLGYILHDLYIFFYSQI